MKTMPPGVMEAGKGLDDISWNILGQTYVPKALCEDSFSWHAFMPPGTMVPPHIHPEQDEFIYMLEGKLDLILDGDEDFAEPGRLDPSATRHSAWPVFQRPAPGQMPVLGHTLAAPL